MPDMPAGVVIESLLCRPECLCESGTIVFPAQLSGPGIVPPLNDQALFVGTPACFTKVLQGGDQAPGCEPGVLIDVEFLSMHGSLSDNGTLRVEADLCTPESAKGCWLGGARQSAVGGVHSDAGAGLPARSALSPSWSFRSQ